MRRLRVGAGGSALQGGRMIEKSAVWHNARERYGLIAQSFHWAMALLIVAAVALGLYSGSFERSDPAREPILVIHKSLGLMILALACLRLAWSLYSPPPMLPNTMKAWERRLARLSHGLLYGLLFAVPLSGFLLSQSAGRDVSFFGWFSLPQIIPIDTSIPPAERWTVIVGAVLHKTVLEIVLYVVVAAHVAGAIKHHFIDRQRAMFFRMWGTEDRFSPDTARK